MRPKSEPAAGGSLLWRAGLFVMVLQALALLALGSWVFFALKRFHYEQKTGELDRLLAMLSPLYTQALRGGTARSGLDAMTDEQGPRLGVRITLVLPDGKVVADSHEDPARTDNHRWRPEIAAAIETGRGTAKRFSHTVDFDMLYVARRLDEAAAAGAAPPVIRVAHSLAEVDGALRGLTRTMALAALAWLLFTSGVVALLSQRLRAAVGRLSEGALRFASGDLDHRVQMPRNRELGALARALNDMAGQLSARIDQLRRQESEQQAILQSMSNGVLALDLEQRILSVNRAAERMLGISGERVRGRLLQEAVRVPALHRFVSDALTDGRSETREFPLDHERTLRIEARSEPLTDARERPTGLLVVLNDVSQLRRLEAMRSDFAANVSHELRTPVTNIKGYVETLMDVDPTDREQTRRFLEVIRQNVDRLTAIIEDMLALTRLEQPRARQAVEKEAISVRELVDAVAEQFRTAAEAKRIAVSCDVPAQLRTAGHRQLLEQAVGNLLSNAINYSPPGTRVRVSAGSCEDGALKISVADEGPGIAAEHLERIFERFYRVDKARSRAVGGTGLGLAIVKHVALVHGGRVEVESEVGRGSTFHIILPALRGGTRAA